MTGHGTAPCRLRDRRRRAVAWEDRLGRHGVAIEGRTAWPRGGQSLYVRDPDGHLLEFATPGLWATY